MERVPCGKTQKCLVNREYRCFYPSIVVTKWRVLTSRVKVVLFVSEICQLYVCQKSVK